MSNKLLAAGVELSGAQSRNVGRSDTSPFKRIFDRVESSLPHARSLIVTTFPRGELQLATSSRGVDALARAYMKEQHRNDPMTWAAILRGSAVGLSDSASTGSDATQTFREFVQSSGMAGALAAPLAAPVLAGYPGALHVYRGAEHGQFNAAETRLLEEIAREGDDLIDEARSQRRSLCQPAVSLTQWPSARVFLYDGTLKPIASSDDATLDDYIAASLIEYGAQQLRKSNDSSGDGDRLTITDRHGEVWVFRAVVRPQLPGLCAELCGKSVLFCQQPDCCDWGHLRSVDLQADSEASRLVPAIRFMQQEFRRSPTLDEISRAVHLSPFHFHRRFAEIFGLTPKHLLLECQINQAKRDLVAREKDLVDIATECGFAHQSHFTSRFKQATGLTPTRWRRLALETLQSPD